MIKGTLAAVIGLLVVGCTSSCSGVPRRSRLVETAGTGGRYEVTDVRYDGGESQAMVSLRDAAGTNITYRWYSYDGSDWREMPMVGVQRPVSLTPVPGAISPTNTPAEAVFTPAVR